jgi:hypothetical protein
MPYIIAKGPEGEFDENIQIYFTGSTLDDLGSRLLVRFDAVVGFTES